MGRPKGWAADRTGRPAMRSPGRPPVGARASAAVLGGDRAGGSSEEAAAEAGVSRRRGRPVVSGGWRHADGHPGPAVGAVSVRSPSGRRSRSCAPRGCGVREIARQLGRSPSTISRELRRNAATRGGGSRVSGLDGAVARRPARPASQAGEAGASTPSCAGYVQDRLSGAVQRPDGSVVAVRTSAGSVGVTAVARTGAGARRGVLSRSLPGCDSTSPMMNRCGSLTRRSISRCTFRAAARCDAS